MAKRKPPNRRATRGIAGARPRPPRASLDLTVGIRTEGVDTETHEAIKAIVADEVESGELRAFAAAIARSLERAGIDQVQLLGIDGPQGDQ